MLGVLLDGEEMLITYDAKQQSDERVRQYAVYLRSNANTILEPSASDRPVITFHVTTVKVPDKTLASLRNATPENSLNVLKIPETERLALSEHITANISQVLYAILAELPMSTLEFLTNGGIL